MDASSLNDSSPSGERTAQGYPPGMDKSCPSCGAPMTTPYAPSYVYAIGKIESRLPTLALEKEFAQVLGRAETAGQTDKQAFHSAISNRDNRYLIRQLCWILTIRGLETYLLYPRDPVDYERLAEAVRPQPSPSDVDVVIGVKGPSAPPELCNGLTLPVVHFDQIYSFDRASFFRAVPKPSKVSSEAFLPAMEEVFDRIHQITENCGATDEHRALNYLAMRYPTIYATAAEAFGRDSSLTAVDVRRSALSGARRIVDVIFTYRNRNTDFEERFRTRVDITEEFPFLVTKLAPSFEH